MAINNSFYEELEEKWYTADDHPIALLRAENAVRIPWIFGGDWRKKTALDIGCGAGLLTNALASAGHRVFGLDISGKSLETARRHDKTKSVTYTMGNALALPYPAKSFDVVSAMDVLEHVEEPQKLIREAARVLKPGGLFFFHTFNRNFLSYLLVIKGVDWCVPNAPKNMHVYPLFIKPKELTGLMAAFGMDVKKMRGFRPQIFKSALLKMIFTKKVPQDFSFCFSKSLLTGYCGFAQKR